MFLLKHKGSPVLVNGLSLESLRRSNGVSAAVRDDGATAAVTLRV